ncbi:uncharacterized protein LOC110819654 [Carica papaya]|uniref:uncharacterized protein LOC110819654 n=1 Tax=Carica papaya TaxID=3649 RepID=UPI000B8CB5C8|nr:uncharacterized protein LOC110819654 [Carica papaya]
MMAMRVSCCLNLPPREKPSLHLPPPANTFSQLPSRKKEECWRKKSAVAMACLVIGLIQVTDINQEYYYSIAAGGKWSEKRMCPPWHANSLETVVPENLPRPSARRRWQLVAFTPNLRQPPPTCFSL